MAIRPVAGLAAVLLLALGVWSAQAQLETSGEQIRISHNTQRQSQFNLRSNAKHPDVVAGGADWVAVWRESSLQSKDEIWGRALGPGGTQVGAEIQLSNTVRPSGSNLDIDWPQVAYDSQAGVYLVVWEAEDQAFRHYEIFGQVFSAGGVGLSPVGNDFRISSAFAARANATARKPAVTYSPDAHEFLVVWEDSRDGTDAFAGTEIYGQRIGPSGAESGKNFRISEATAPGTQRVAQRPAVAYNTGTKDYLVAWYDNRHGVKLQGSAILSESYAQRLAPDGSEIGPDLRLEFEPGDAQSQNSDPPPGSDDPQARALDVAADPATGRYLVVFEQGGFQKADGKGQQPQIVGWLVQPAPTNARFFYTVSDLFRQPVCKYQQCGYGSVQTPSVARSTTGKEWLVTWLTNGLENEAETQQNLADWRYEIFGQRIDDKTRQEQPCPGITFEEGGSCESKSSTEVGEDFQISHMGDTQGHPEEPPRRGHKAGVPAVTYSAAADQFLVAWDGDGLPEPYQEPGTPAFYDTDDWLEIWGQLLKGPAPDSGGPGEPIGEEPPPGGPPPSGGQPPGGNPPPGGEDPDEGEDFFDFLLELLARLSDEGGGVAILVVGCPEDSPDPTCAGEVTAETADKLPAGSARAATSAKRRLKLRAVKFSIPRGTSKPVKLKLTREVTKALAKRGKLKLRITVDRGRAGKTLRTIVLRAPTSQIRATKAGAFKVRVAFGPTVDGAKGALVRALRGKTLAASTLLSKAPSGKTKLVGLKLDKPALAVLRRKRRLALVVETIVITRAGAAQIDKQPVTLTLPKSP